MEKKSWIVQCRKKRVKVKCAVSKLKPLDKMRNGHNIEEKRANFISSLNRWSLGEPESRSAVTVIREYQT